MKKVVIFGVHGAGKSVLARQLGHAHSLPVFHLDRYTWHPGWRQINKQAFHEIHAALIAQDRWIVEGNSMMTIKERIAAADTVIFLDPPRPFCLWRVIKRRFFYSKQDRVHRPCGCKEKITWELARDILWRYRHNYYDEVSLQLQHAKKLGKTVHVIRSFQAAQSLL